MTSAKPRYETTEKQLRVLLDQTRNRAKRDRNLTSAIIMWMTDCASRTLHIYETVEPQDYRVRSELVRAKLAATNGLLFQSTETFLSWANLQEIAFQAASKNLTAAGWAVRSVAWTLKDIETAWNCAAAAVNAVEIAYPSLETDEVAWQAFRLRQLIENDAVSPVEPGIRYHP